MMARTTGATRAVHYILLCVASVFAVFPFYWALNTAFKSDTSILHSPPEAYPTHFDLSHFGGVLSDPTMMRMYLNSFILGIFTVLIVLVVSVHAAYAAARLQFRGRSSVLFLLLATIMMPGIVTIIPQYLLAVNLGLYNTYAVLILVFSAFQTPVVIWILRGFFLRVPAQLEEAARIDGCSRLGAFYRVVLPTSGPGLAAAAILTFVNVWNEFILALNLTISNSVRPVTVGLYFTLGDLRVDWGRLAAGSVLALVPVAALFLFLQKYFVEGLTRGAMKG